jgi:chemotaxis protein histidine kinase CheA/ActR/RegA family two-component response regulator
MSSAASQRLSVEAELSNLATELLEVFMAPAEDSVDTRTLLKNYIRHVTRCGLAAGRSGQVHLQDHCVQFQHILKSLLEQPADVVTRYQAVLEQWPLLLMSHLSNEADATFSQQLDELIRTTSWPHDAEPAQSVTEEPADATDSDQSTNALGTEALPGPYAALRSELDAILAALTAMQQSTAAVIEADWHTLLADTADALELFAVSAAAAGAFGVMDAAQLFQASLRLRLTQPLSAREDTWRDITTMHAALTQYLASPQLPASSTGLITAIRQLALAEPLTDTELAALEALLFDHDTTLVATTTDATTTQADTTAKPVVTHETHGVTTTDETSSAQPAIEPELSAQARELLQLIAAEFEQVTAELAASLQALLDDNTAPAQHSEVVAAYTSTLERFASVFESIGLDGLSAMFNGIRDFLQTRDVNTPPSDEQQFWLAEWPAHVLNYLSDPKLHAQTLIAHCQAEASPLPQDPEAVRQLTERLSHPHIDTGEDEASPRQTVAEASDVSLQLPDDVNQQLLDSLLQELPHQTAEFSRVIANVVHGKGSLQDVETAQRVAHTLKGAANTVGVAGIANLTHHIEDILLAFTRQKVLPVTPLTDTLQDAADVLEMMSETLLGVGSVPQQQALAVLQQILDWANQIDLNGLPEATPVSADDSTPLAMQEDKTTLPAASDSSLRISMQSVDETLRLIGESMIVNAQLQDGLRRALMQNKAVHAQSTLFQQLAFELEQLIDVRGMHTLFGGVTDITFDALEMDQYNELHTLTRRMVEAATDARALTQVAEDELKNLEALSHQQKRHHKDTQDVVMKTRMLPVQTIVPRLQRSVRQTCRLTGKLAELIVSGAQTLLDNDILTGLADPLMHVLRNAVDHGIELPELREQKGKPRSGTITLDFAREGEHILIRCRDDGAGLDYAAIRRVAVAKGLVTETAEPSTEELTRLIFVAGLSTREETTQMSGRGIGMDAVLTQIAKMKGSIKVASDAQQGTQIEIQLPITLVTLHGIMSLAGDQVMAVSNRGVEQILYADAGEVVQRGNKLSYLYKDECYTAYFLEDLLDIPRSTAQADDLKRPALLLNSGEGNKAVVLVEKIVATQDIVIKKLGQYVPPLTGVEGVTILGDGSVAPVIDLTVLVAAFDDITYVPRIEHSDLSGIQFGTPKVLVVDDSLSARNSLAEFMQDSGYRVFTARDGVEAIDQLEEHAPDILLVDMEMPRMNGLELTSYVRANQATQNLPIIMITSRATDKHRREADKAGVNAYMIKPYTETELLDQVEAQLASAFSIKQQHVHRVNGVNV